jgi:diguanylate cyclase (GGDEF)-like protein
VPARVAADDMIQHRDGFTFAPYNGLLVSTEGRLVEKVQQEGRQVWILRSGGQIFQARLPEESPSENLAQINPGSTLRVTGITVAERGVQNDLQSLALLLRSDDDVELLARSWWNSNYWFLMCGILTLVVLLSLGLQLQTRRLLSELNEPSKQAEGNSLTPWRLASEVAGAISAATAFVVLIGGWGLHQHWLTTPIPSRPAMYPNAALGLTLAGLSLIVSRRSFRAGRLVANICAGAALAIGLITVLEYVAGWNFGFDELIFKDTLSVVGTRGRMAPSSAVCLVLVGASLLWLTEKRRVAVSQALALAAATLCLLNLVAHLYGVQNLFAFGSQRGMAVHSIGSFLILSVGILAAEPKRGVMRSITSDAPGGVMARTLLPAAVVVPAFLGWLRWQAQFTLKLFDTSTGLAIFASANIMVFGFLVWLSAELLNRSDAARERARFAADHDVLTSLLNRKGVMELLERELHRCKRQKLALSIILADIDHFKSVNDTLGHEAGDDVLREAAKRFRHGLRVYDSAGRFGGEEFLLVLPGCRLEDAVQRAEETREQLARTPITLQTGGSREVTTSMGVAAMEGVVLSAEELLRRADGALYKAKRDGRNRVKAHECKDVPQNAEAEPPKAAI